LLEMPGERGSFGARSASGNTPPDKAPTPGQGMQDVHAISVGRRNSKGIIAEKLIWEVRKKGNRGENLMGEDVAGRKGLVEVLH